MTLHIEESQFFGYEQCNNDLLIHRILLSHSTGRELPVFREPLEKYIVLHLKTLSDLLDAHPFSFLPLLNKTLQFICEQCFSAEALNHFGTASFRRFNIFAINLLKQVLICMEYKPPKHATRETIGKVLRAYVNIAHLLV